MRINLNVREFFSHLRFLFPLKKIKEDELITDFPEELINFLQTRVSSASTFVEYGAGASTLIIASTGAQVFCCETDNRFIDALSHLNNVQFANPLMGKIGPWGTQIFQPWRKKTKSQGQLYSRIIWNLYPTIQPNFVLIDGRFRLACALEIISRFQGSETLMIIDDYETRAEYHLVEKYAKKEKVMGRAAVFQLNSSQFECSELKADLEKAYFDHR